MKVSEALYEVLHIMLLLALSLIMGNMSLLTKSIGKSELNIYFLFYKRTSMIITDDTS